MNDSNVVYRDMILRLSIVNAGAVVGVDGMCVRYAYISNYVDQNISTWA